MTNGDGKGMKKGGTSKRGTRLALTTARARRFIKTSSAAGSRARRSLRARRQHRCRRIRRGDILRSEIRAISDSYASEDIIIAFLLSKLLFHTGVPHDPRSSARIYSAPCLYARTLLCINSSGVKRIRTSWSSMKSSSYISTPQGRSHPLVGVAA